MVPSVGLVTALYAASTPKPSAWIISAPLASTLPSRPFEMPLNSSEEQSWDSTAFLVGEFNGSNGSIARFNGFGELTLIAVDGSQSCGSYSLTEYEKKPATVVIELPGARCEYTFALSDGSGAFTLTDAAGSSYTFTPVIY